MAAFWPIGTAQIILIVSYPIRKNSIFWLFCMQFVKELYHTLEDMIAGSASSGSFVQSKNDVCAVSRRKINVAILVLGDKIIAINETSIEGMPHDQAMSLLRDDSLKILHLTLKKKELYKIKGRSKEVLFNNQVNSWLDQFQYINIQTWLRGLGK